ncbi:CPBP family intramembrane glutamic endopeptidase [Rhizohabitans arisaemae]|uniref:CPBP family intramembrane glutamic endopeptidase n=1 Tax=Rhizohabitans arisaemae TaxID=2720610 RepID=UPI0024B28101|nr:CPBP family intramembrane glutamic endopeptidase [Rhizohabitans arisaemae]
MPSSGVVPGVAVLTAANLLNNRYARRWSVPTSVAATVLLVGIARRSGASWADLGLDRHGRGLRAGGALAAGVAAVYAAGAALPATRVFFEDERAAALDRSALLRHMLVDVPLGTVLLEEVGFRGVLYGLLRRSHGTAVATGVSSLLFGLWHVLPAQDLAKANPALATATSAGETDGVRLTLGAVASTGLAGVLFCELNRRSRSILAPVGLHLATNSLGYLAAWLVSRRGRRGGDDK